MEEIGKLVHELFDEIRKENAELKAINKALDEDNRGMVRTLSKIEALVRANIEDASAGGKYIGSFWHGEADEIFKLLGIEEEAR